jgi:hypothetical protein
MANSNTKARMRGAITELNVYRRPDNNDITMEEMTTEPNDE